MKESTSLILTITTKPKWYILKTGAFLCLILFCSKTFAATAPSKELPSPYLRPILFSVANIFRNNMVLQREKPIVIWGKALRGDRIQVRASWVKRDFFANADSANTWKVIIPASPANNIPQTVTFTDTTVKKVIKITNILIGDVWLCAGQSNMAMPIAKSPPSFDGVINYENEIAAANDSLIHFTTVDALISTKELDTLVQPAKWQICTSATSPFMSAVAYYFGKSLTSALNVPIGLIIAAANGSFCESWISPNRYDNSLLLKRGHLEFKSLFYNGMINPWLTYPIKGVIWYQGESNKKNSPDQFFNFTKTLILDWRTLFRDEKLPFYFVQLAPFDEKQTNNSLLNDYAKIREAQAALLTLPNTGMAVTMDVGEVHNQHPRNKKPVGERLSLIALNKTYHKRSYDFCGPQFKSFTVRDSIIIIKFKGGTANHLQTINNQPLKQFFAIEGSDCRFVPAQAQIYGDKIRLTILAKVPRPIQAIRYAFTNFPVTNIQNGSGLPMEPFRSDNYWDQ